MPSKTPFTNATRGINHIGVSACALIHDGTGRILLQKRGPKARDEQGRWDICGGAIEFGDTIEETIIKELQEELLVAPLDMEFLGVSDVHRKQNGVNTHWIAITYSVKVDPKLVKIGEPHKISEIGWFGLDDLPSPLHSQAPKVLKPAQEQGIIK